jgi:hypothetical protein
MGRSLSESRYREWQERLDRYRASGLSVVKFCRLEGVSQANFYVWRQRLKSLPLPAATPPTRGSSATSASSATASVDNAAGNVAPPTSRPLASRSASVSAGALPAAARMGTFLEVPLLASSESLYIEVILVDGTTIRLPADHLAALNVTLERLLTADRSIPDSRSAVGSERRHA